jgi:hypothetical protein
MDLDPASRRALELDAVLESVAARAVTPEGARVLRTLPLLGTAAEAGEEQAAVGEVAAEIQSTGRLLPAGIPDASIALGALGMEGMRIDPLPLRDPGRGAGDGRRAEASGGAFPGGAAPGSSS